MNVLEGSRRMQRLGRVGVLFACVVVTLTVLIAVVGYFMGHWFEINALPLVALLAVYPALGGGILWMAGWIVEGFATPKDDHPQDHPSSLPSEPHQQQPDRA
jgi:hypothetical protein